jgi:endonuclease YncB( thermonuclease family)
MFKVDYTVPTTKSEYGSIFLKEDNVAHLVVREGWAEVREARANEAENPELLALLQCKDEAVAAKRGIWSDNQDDVSYL